MCYRFRIISKIRSNNEFSSRETKILAIRMNTKMLNAFLLFSRKRNNDMSWNFRRLVYYIGLSLDSCKVWKHLQTPRVCNGFNKSASGGIQWTRYYVTAVWFWRRQLWRSSQRGLFLVCPPNPFLFQFLVSVDSVVVAAVIFTLTDDTGFYTSTRMTSNHGRLNGWFTVI